MLILNYLIFLRYLKWNLLAGLGSLVLAVPALYFGYKLAEGFLSYNLPGALDWSYEMPIPNILTGIAGAAVFGFLGAVTASNIVQNEIGINFSPVGCIGALASLLIIPPACGIVGLL